MLFMLVCDLVWRLATPRDQALVAVNPAAVTPLVAGGYASKGQPERSDPPAAPREHSPRARASPHTHTDADSSNLYDVRCEGYEYLMS